jgi:uncharacterized protein
MKISMHAMAVDTFVPMLESLAGILDKAAVYAEAAKVDLVSARLAPDMFTLAQQVEEACFHAKYAMSLLTGQPPAVKDGTEKSLEGLKTQIARTLEYVRGIPVEAFDGADERDCSIEAQSNEIVEMDGLRFLKSWALPHFYFHIVTAYGILRSRGVAISKNDYLRQVTQFTRAKQA